MVTGGLLAEGGAVLCVSPRRSRRRGADRQRPPTPLSHRDDRPTRTPRLFHFFQAEDAIRDRTVTGVQTCALPIYVGRGQSGRAPQRDEVGRTGAGTDEGD